MSGGDVPYAPHGDVPYAPPPPPSWETLSDFTE